MAPDPTLLIHWIFSCITLLIIGTRLIWRRAAGQKFNAGDYLSMAAAICALARLAIIHIVLTWGTNNLSTAYRKSHVFGADEIYRREVGSKLAITNRVFYNSYLWLQKLVLLDVYRRVIKNLPFEKISIWSFLVVFFGSYVAVQVTTFTECQPFHLYWQVVPDPGECARAQVQLIVVGVLNVVTDAMLLALPLPVVFSMKTATWKRRGQLLMLFTLGIFVIAITIIRLPINSSNADSQVSRTTWASTELLVAAMVVNAPTLWGLWNKKRQESRYAKSSGKGQGGDSSGPGLTGSRPGTPRGGDNASGADMDGIALGRPRTGARRIATEGDSDSDAYALAPTPRRQPSITNGGITLTREVMVTESREELDDSRSSRSSQKGILKT